MSKENSSKQSNVWSPVVTCIGVSASKFVGQTDSSSKIDRYFTTKKSALLSAKETKGKGKEDIGASNGIDEDHFIVSDQEDEENELELHDQQQSEEIPQLSNALEVILTCPESQDGEPSVTEASESAKCSTSADQEGSLNAKKTGFFANRNLKKVISPIENQPETKIGHSDPVPQSSSSFSIDELFPDLENIDMDTVALLPIHLRREILQKIENANRTCAEATQNVTENLIVCEKCNKSLLAEELAEHKDYHMAFDLQNEFTSQPSTSNALTAIKHQPATKKSSKRSLKDKKKSNMDSKRSRTIDSFFNTPSS